LDNYARAATDKNRKDFALELGTGSGKTLVGLLIGEYHRRDSDSRVVYLCSTNQLVYQTTARAKEYGVPAIPFVGTKKNYVEADLASFQRGASIAITSYAGLFNAGPGLNDPEVIICDDAHAGESYVAAMWSLRVTASGTDKPIFQALLNFFGDLVKPEMRHVHGSGSSRDVDLIPLPTYADRLNQLQALLDVHCFKKETRSDVKFPWIAIKGHLSACCIYVSPGAFLIRPLIPPTYAHAPFADARHRVYMSATLGEDGDLERMYGVGRIQRIYSDDVREANTGRRLILFPGMMTPEGHNAVEERALEKDHRVLLVTDMHLDTLATNSRRLDTRCSTRRTLSPTCQSSQTRKGPSRSSWQTDSTE